MNKFDFVCIFSKIFYVSNAWNIWKKLFLSLIKFELFPLELKVNVSCDFLVSLISNRCTTWRMSLNVSQWTFVLKYKSYFSAWIFARRSEDKMWGTPTIGPSIPGFALLHSRTCRLISIIPEKVEKLRTDSREFFDIMPTLSQAECERRNREFHKVKNKHKKSINFF